MNEDGCLFHLGRVDQGIRIAGEFVAAADVEKVLLGVPGVLQVAVRDYVDPLGELRLCAYLITPTDAGITVTGLREALSKQIAKHHMPAAFVFLDALPPTKDLKIDYLRLPQPGRQRPALPDAYVAPRTAFEQELAQIWEEVLDIRPIGIHDNFFELGGHSLTASRVISLVIVRFQLKVPVKLLFDLPTVAEMALVIAANEAGLVTQDELEGMLSEVEAMSHEEVQLRLNKGSSTISKK